MSPIQVQVPAAVRLERERVADGVLARWPFQGLMITERRVSWQHEVVREDAGDRLYTVVYAEDPAAGGLMRAQFNVFFAPGTATVTDSYEGDWCPCD